VARREGGVPDRLALAGAWCRKFPGDPNRTYFGKVSAAEAVNEMSAAKEKRTRTKSERRDKGTARWTTAEVREIANLASGHGQDRNLDAIIRGQEFDREILQFYMRGDNRPKLVAIVEPVRQQIWPDAV
jgi:hypothetical protein